MYPNDCNPANDSSGVLREILYETGKVLSGYQDVIKLATKSLRIRQPSVTSRNFR